MPESEEIEAPEAGDVAEVDRAEPAVLRTVLGQVLLLELNRPQVRNAVNHQLAVELSDALDVLDSDPELRCCVLAGRGRGFCAGMDLKAFVAGENPSAGGRGFAGIVQRPPEKPIIAAIEGFAVAGGLEVALACDLRVASRSAVLGLPEVKRALVATGGALRRLPLLLGPGVAMEMALTGDSIDAGRAFDLGLVNRVCDPGHATETAIELAGSIACNGPLAITATKSVLTRLTKLDDDAFWIEQQVITDQVTWSNDAREGSLAFTEKREPVWTGT